MRLNLDTEIAATFVARGQGLIEVSTPSHSAEAAARMYSVMSGLPSLGSVS